MGTKWRISGSLLGACNCDWGCPCSFDAPPTYGACHGTYVWIVKTGTFGATVRLDGLAFASAGSHPGPIHLGHGTSVTLVDDRATPAQRKAIETLRRGGGGPPFSIFAKTTERWLPTVYAPFDVRLNGVRSVVKVDGGRTYHLAISRIKNPVTGDEEEVYLDKPTGFTAKRTELGMSLVARVNVPGLVYDVSGQYAEYSEFSYSRK